MGEKISIITICRNAGEELRQTIDSVLSQSYKEIEYIFVDGNSTDKATTDIINLYKDKFNYFLQEEDSGIYEAMNKGIKAATGDLILFLNAGDRLADKISIEAIINLIAKKEAMIYFADVVWVDVQKKVVRAGLPEINFSEDLRTNNFPHSGTFYRKECFDRYGLFDEKFKILGDYDMNLRLLITHGVSYCVLDNLVAFFYTGGISTSEKGQSLRKNEMEKIKSNYFSDESKEGKIFKLVKGTKKAVRLNRVK